MEEKPFSSKIKNLKHLIGNLAVVSSPFSLLGEILKWETSLFKKREIFADHFDKIDRRLLTQKDGYDGIELLLWGLFDENWNINQKRMEIYKSSNLPIYTFHACYESFPKKFKNAYLNLAEDNPMIKKALKAHIDAASELSGQKTILVFHPGAIERESDRERALNNVVENIGSCLDYAESKKVTVTLENMSKDPRTLEFCTDLPELEYILKKVNNKNLKITLDWGHLNTKLQDLNYQKYFKRRNKFSPFSHINNFIKELGENIAHAHIHYNRNHKEGNSRHVRRSILRKFIIYFLFWTSFSKFIREKEHIEYIDEHLTLNRAEEQDLVAYEETIKDLLTKTRILDYGFITHEIIPKKMFKIITYAKNGAKYKDYIAHLEIFKKMLRHIEENYD